MSVEAMWRTLEVWQDAIIKMPPGGLRDIVFYVAVSLSSKPTVVSPHPIFPAAVVWKVVKTLSAKGLSIPNNSSWTYDQYVNLHHGGSPVRG